MPAVLLAQEAVARGLARWLVELLHGALHQLSEPDAHRAEAVHETRKLLERARAALSLWRAALGKQVAAAIAANVQHAWQALGPLRAEDLLPEALQKLRTATRDTPYHVALEPVHAALLQRAAAPRSLDEILPPILLRLRAALAQAEQSVTHHTERSVQRSIHKGLRRGYKRARRAYRQAAQDPTPKHLRTLAKRIKDVLYALVFLQRSRSKKLAPFIDQLDAMTSALGDEHDLQQLIDLVRAENLGGVVAVALTSQLVATQREALLRRTVELGLGPFHTRRSSDVWAWLVRAIQRRQTH